MTATTLEVAVTVEQIGIAPFYYELGMEMRCGSWAGFQPGIERLINNGDSMELVFQGIPMSANCLNNISLHLVSPFVTYEVVPIKFAQGDGTVRFQLPLPNGETFSPSRAPSSVPTPAPLVPGTALLFIKSDQSPDAKFSVSPPGTVYFSGDNVVAPDGYNVNIFKYHRWACNQLTYTIYSNLEPDSVYIMKLGFIELYGLTCQNNARVMQVSVNGVVKVTGLDVYKVAGCRTGHVETIEVSTDSFGNFVVTLVGLIENPMITFIEVFTAQPATSPSDFAFFAAS